MESHLLQMRGLKQIWKQRKEHRRRSHLLQMRGLKQKPAKIWSLSVVASFTDAWIETVSDWSDQKNMKSHLLQMRGLKPGYCREIIPGNCRIFYRCVD